MKSERRFRGRMSEEYELIRRVMPHFDILQRKVGDEVSRMRPAPGDTPLRVLEIGCGDGITTENILSAVPRVFVTAIDSEPKMISGAAKRLKAEIRACRCEIIQADVREYLKSLPAQSFDAVASAFVLHNLRSADRERAHRQIYRVLKKGGILVNADEYAPDDDAERFAALRIALKRFFRTFLPRRRYRLLEEWVLHNVADQAPDRVMKARATIQSLRKIGFRAIRQTYRREMEAVLVARRG